MEKSYILTALRKFIIFLIFSMTAFNACGQQLYDLSKISEEKIIIDSRLVTGHEDELRHILLLVHCNIKTFTIIFHIVSSQ